MINKQSEINNNNDQNISKNTKSNKQENSLLDKIYRFHPDQKINLNIYQFIVGGILLLISGFYMHYNPAERVAIFSGAEILIQKINIAGYHLYSGKGHLLDNKYRQLRELNEIISTMDDIDCDIEGADKLRKKYEQVENMDMKTYKANRYDILTTVSIYSRKIEENCSINMVQRN